MRKSIGWFFVSILVAIMCMGWVVAPIKPTILAAEELNLSLLEAEFARTPETLEKYNIPQACVDDYTPFDITKSTRFIGNSYTPTLVGEESRKHINAEFNVSADVSSFDASDIKASTTALEIWVSFDRLATAITRGFSITITDDADTNSIVWNISVDELRTLITRDEESISDSDKAIFGAIGSNIPVGWVKFVLPVVSGTVTGELVSAGKLNITKCKIVQDDGVGADQPLSFYGIRLVKIDETNTAKTSEIASYSAIAIKPSAKVSNKEKYYIGELYPKFMNVNDVFSACWIGRVNYLTGTNLNSLKVETDTGIGETPTTYYSYGAGDFLIKHTSYTLSYGLMYQNRFVRLLSDSISAQDYGKGVWLENDNKGLEIGATKKIYYTVHEAFSGAVVSFESTNKEVLKIVEVNEMNKFVVVEALKKGDAGIKITVTHDRLEGTEYETTGLINEDFEIEVVKPQKKANTTVIILWIGLGTILAVGLYFAIKSIIESRKIEIR